MKKQLILLLNLLSISIIFNHHTISSSDNPLLVILLMVKNEEAVMEKTLLPYLQSNEIDSFVILDTGSTDKTIEVTQDLFKKHNKNNAYIIEQPFVDFSTSRNYLIEEAEKLFPKATFFLMIDAEWYFNGVEKLLQFCHNNKQSHEVAYQTPMASNYPQNPQNNKNFYLTRLFRPLHNVRFSYPVHEDIFVNPKGMLPPDICFIYEPDARGQAKSSSRNQRDLELLLEEHAKHPNDLRTIYFLGQTCANLKDYAKAREYYIRVLEDPECNIEAKAIMHYRVGILYRSEGNWEKALYHYLQSYETCPEKAEALIEIATYYYTNQQYALAYLFALHSSTIPYPEHHLFNEKFAYEYRRYCILAATALQMKQYQVGEEAAREALKVTPNDQYLLNNLAFCKQKNNEILQQ